MQIIDRLGLEGHGAGGRVKQDEVEGGHGSGMQQLQLQQVAKTRTHLN